MPFADRIARWLTAGAAIYLSARIIPALIEGALR